MAVVLMACTIGTYANALAGPFVYDDHQSIVNNSHIREWWPLTSALDAERQTPTAGRPVVNLSLAINFAIGGLSPWGYHAWNLGTHLLCGLLLFGVLRRTFMLPSLPAFARDHVDWLAFAAALIWLLHPLQTEVVDYVTQRSESMMALFYLFTMYAAIRSMTAQRRAAAPFWTIVAVAACVLGMATKEPMVSAPVVIWLFDAAFVAGSPGRAIRERRVLYTGLAATWMVLIALNISGPRSNAAGFGAGVSPATYLLNQAEMLTTYLKLAVWPLPLVFDDGLPRDLVLNDVWREGLVIVVLLVATAVLLWRWPKLAFPGVWFFAMLAPSSSIVPIATEVGAERRMYLALAALVVVVVMIAGAVWARIRPRVSPVPYIPLVALGLVCGLLTSVTVRRNREYRTELNIWQTVLDRRPQGRAHYNVGVALKNEGRRADALKQFEAAVPDTPEAEYAIGFELESDQQFGEAITHYREFIRRRPDDENVPRAYNQIGRAFIALEQLDDAVAAFRQTLRIRPQDADAHGGLGDALLQQGKYDDAIGAYSQYVQLAPGNAAGHFNLGLALVERNREREAIEEFARAVSLQPGDALMRESLGIALSSAHRYDEAVPQLRAALAAEPARVTSHNALGAALAAQGKLAEAVSEYRRTLERDPTNAEALARLVALQPNPQP